MITLSSIKARLGIAEADVKDDAFLTAAIAAVLSRFESVCNRKFPRSAAATFEFRADEESLIVDRYPIESVGLFELKSNEADGWQEVSGVVFMINQTRSIIELSAPLGSPRQLGRVTFAGGYVLPGTTAEAGQTELPEDLVQAATEQVAAWFQHRDKLGIGSISGQGGSVMRDPVSVVKPLDLLPVVINTLGQYERYLM